MRDRFFCGIITVKQVLDNKGVKIATLKKRSDFLRVASVGKKWISKAMIIQVSKQPENVEYDIRIGYTASKKVGNAVIRNRAKRRLREAVKQVLKVDGSANHDYVLIARREIIGYSFKELIRDLKWSIRKLHAGTTTKDGSETS